MLYRRSGENDYFVTINLQNNHKLQKIYLGIQASFVAQYNQIVNCMNMHIIFERKIISLHTRIMVAIFMKMKGNDATKTRLVA